MVVVPVGRGGRVWGAVVMCVAQWSYEGCCGRVGRGGRVWGAAVMCVERGGCAWDAVVVHVARSGRA